METPVRISITKHFATLQDPRVLRTQRHPFVSIIILAVCGVICGADTWVDIEDFSNTKLSGFQTWLDLPNGIPSHDTFGRVFAVINPHQFQERFLSWVQELIAFTKGQVVALDGKTLRRSHNQSDGKAAIHMVSAWAAANRVVLGQLKVDEKSNEITAIPELLGLLDIRGCTVTIDAMGCQTAIANQIRAQGADYVLALKENQENLYREVIATFAMGKKDMFASVSHSSYETTEKGHGRIENRRYVIITEKSILAYLNPDGAWKDLCGIGMVESERTIKEKMTTDVRYYLLSSTKGAMSFANAVRSHWGIENQLHWVLDIAFREDESRIRKGNGDQNFALLRHIALNLIRQEPSKGSVHTKRLRAGWDDSYLLTHLTQ